MSRTENNLIAILQFRSQYAADKVAYRFIDDEQALVQELTYGALHRQAVNIAAELRRHCNKGDRVLMMYHSSFEFIPAFFGCLYAGVIAVPAYPPRKNHNALRLLSIIEDAGVQMIAATAQVQKQIRAMDGYETLSDQTAWINTETVKEIPAATFIPVVAAGDDVMFLQYTSGSTGRPKGVIVTHDNMRANLAMLYDALEVNDNSVYISWLPYFHDMGLIGVILEAMYAGVPAVMMSPAYFLQKPVRWLQAISTYGGTVSGAPNFAYDLCVDKIRDEDLEGIDLSTWKVAFNGAEPVSAKTIERFCHRFEKYGFKRNAMLPSFGLAEATLFVSARLHADGPQVMLVDQAALLKGKALPADNDNARVDIVSCGITWHGHGLAIVDPATGGRCPDGTVGELWFNGPTVAKGYWNKPQATREVFEAYIAESNEGPYLRTGDLAFLLNGALYITGRLKDVIIIRGGNYYPQDLEFSAWESHPALSVNNAAAFTVETGGTPQLVIVQEVQRMAVRDLQAGEIFEAVISRIASEYQLQIADIVLLPPGSILKTSSGKIQRQANRQAYLDGAFKPLAQWKQVDGAATVLPGKQATKEQEGSRRELEHWMKERVAELVQLPVTSIAADKDFSSFGLDSVGAIQLSGALQNHLGRDVPPGLVYDYPSVSLLAGYLSSDDGPAVANITAGIADDDHDIAVIGMSCRFPGANDIAEFEQLLFDGKNMITTPGTDAPADGDPRQVTYRAGYMRGVDLFDAGFFEIAPKEAKSVDPQQRLLLELCYTAMQHAGYAPQTLKGSAVGVFVGISNFDYAQLSLGHAQHKTAYFGTGVALSIAANRVSYFFNFKGPSLSIDTACSSSLVAVHQAVRSIRSGESSMALAGGVNLILSDTVNEYLDAGKLLAQDGHCKTFDASADGYVRGEGAGVILLKSKKRAIEDNDNILAVIKGSAVVQDGHSNGLLAPNGVSQQQVVQYALADAGVSPGTISYVEAHGTGTALGDPIEVAALDHVLRTGREKANRLIVGSVKANIGHLESAAGIAGLIKTVICLGRKQVPRQVHFKTHNPNISWEKLCVQIPETILELDAGGKPVRAGVSSFGFGGTNAHAILEEYIQSTPVAGQNPGRLLPYNLFPLSAKTAEALTAQAKSLSEFLNTSGDQSLNDLAYSLATARDHFPHRLVIKSAAVEALGETLKEITQHGYDHPTVVCIPPGVQQGHTAFLFTGGGAQYAGMADALYAEQPVFRDTIDECVLLANRWLDVDLKQILFSKQGTREETLLHRIDYMQPALFAYEYAMSRLWMSWGVQPDVLIGHSLGEIVAACVAGVFSLEDGIKLICSRGRLMQSLPPGGVMISLQANEAAVKEAIADALHAVSIAVINGPDQTVIAGEQIAAEEIKGLFDRKGVKTKTLQVSHASHSVLMEPILEAYGEVLSTISFRKPKCTLISNTTGKEADESICTVQYWKDHLRNTVRFSSGIGQLEKSGVRTFIEVGPNPVLLGIAKECIEDNEALQWLPAARSADAAIVYDSVAQWYAAGGNIDWAAFYKGLPVRKTGLPAYPFQKESYWIDTTAAISSQGHSYSGKLLLGQKIDVAGDTVVFESLLDTRRFAYLADHRVMGKMLVPGSFYCDIIQSYIALPEQENWEIEELLFEKPLVPEAAAAIRLQLLLHREGEHHIHFSIHAAEAHTGQAWPVLARGTLRLAGDKEAYASLAACKKQYTEAYSVHALYDDFEMKGMAYGACFQSVTDIYRTDKAVLGKIVLPQMVGETELNEYELHPVLLDGSFQLLNALVADASHAYLPFCIEGYRLFKKAGAVLWAELTVAEAVMPGDTLSASIVFWNEHEECVGHIEKLSVRKAADALFKSEVRYDYQYHLDWKIIQPELKKQVPVINEKWLLITGDNTCETVKAVANELEKRGAVLVWAENINAVRTNSSIDKIVCFWNGACSNQLDECAEANALAGLAQLQEFQRLSMAGTSVQPGGYWWVTESANAFTQNISVNPALATLWGLGRVFMREHPDVPFRLLDVANAGNTGGIASVLIDLVSAPPAENELAIDGKQLYALRLAGGLQHDKAAVHRQLVFTEAAGFESLVFKPVQAKKLQETEVEIEVKYAGLNFRDIFRVLGLIANDKGELGGECSGVVVSIGAGVKNIKPGDEVMALAEGSFANRVTTDYRLVAKLPAGLDFKEAATIPIAFLTAWYGFKNLADVQRGERVLVHSAAGGVGMAAIQIVQHLGGQIYGTASRSKWNAVRRSGVTHIYDSRTLEFYEQVLNDTNGEGVDVVLNSFIDKFVDRSLELLSQNGRFLEIGKRDIRNANDVTQAHPGVSYAAYDLIYLMQHQQDLIQEMFAALTPLFESRILRPIAATCFTADNAQEAFQFMSKAKHVGKVILEIAERNQNDEAPFQLTPASTVLITGGLGGLALEVARYLVRKYNIAHLLLLGRRAPSPELLEEIQLLEQSGATVTVKQADVADRTALADIISGIPAGYPLKAVLHLAGMLDDAAIGGQDKERFQRVMAPKIKGAWNLHELTRHHELELFVLFSSASAVLGSVGQSNYAAANAFLDSLAFYRRRSGLPACAVSWGPWEATGLVHRLGGEHQLRIRKQGIGLLSGEDAIALLDDVLKKRCVQPVLLPVLKNTLAGVYQSSPYMLPSLLKDMLEQKRGIASAKEPGTWLRKLAGLNPKQREQYFIETLQQEIARILSVSDAKKIHLDKSLQEFGMDSLMAVELRNKLSALTGKKLPVTLLFDYPNVLALAAYLDKQVGAANEQTKAAEVPLKAGWKEVVFEQLLSELAKDGSGQDHRAAVKRMVDDLELTMQKAVDKAVPEITNELDGMSLEELENEFEKELKSI